MNIQRLIKYDQLAWDNARRELGPNATLGDIARRAQELKERYQRDERWYVRYIIFAIIGVTLLIIAWLTGRAGW